MAHAPPAGASGRYRCGRLGGPGPGGARGPADRPAYAL